MATFGTDPTETPKATTSDKYGEFIRIGEEQMLGWPSLRQGSMQAVCESEASGIDIGDVPAELADQWKLLLQYTYNGDETISALDTGTLHGTGSVRPTCVPNDSTRRSSSASSNEHPQGCASAHRPDRVASAVGIGPFRSAARYSGLDQVVSATSGETTGFIPEHEIHDKARRRRRRVHLSDLGVVPRITGREVDAQFGDTEESQRECCGRPVVCHACDEKENPRCRIEAHRANG